MSFRLSIAFLSLAGKVDAYTDKYVQLWKPSGSGAVSVNCYTGMGGDALYNEDGHQWVLHNQTHPTNCWYEGLLGIPGCNAFVFVPDEQACYLLTKTRLDECEEITSDKFADAKYQTFVAVKDHWDYNCGGTPLFPGDPPSLDWMRDCLGNDKCIGWVHQAGEPGKYYLRASLDDCEDAARYTVSVLGGHKPLSEVQLEMPETDTLEAITTDDVEAGANPDPCPRSVADHVTIGGLCLAYNPTVQNGDPVTLWDCETAVETGLKRDWNVGGQSIGTAVSHHYHMPDEQPYCLDAGDMLPGSQLFLWECNGYPQQMIWADDTSGRPPLPLDENIAPFEGPLKLSGAWDGLCLDGESPVASGNPVILWECNELEQQVWSWCRSVRRPRSTQCSNFPLWDNCRGTWL